MLWYVASGRVVSCRRNGKGGKREREGISLRFFFLSISTILFFFDELLVRDTEYDLFPRS